MLKKLDLNHKLYTPKTQALICMLLIAALMFGLFFPRMEFQKLQPELSLESTLIEDIQLLEIGENLKNLNTILVPEGRCDEQNEAVIGEEVSEDSKNEELGIKEELPEEVIEENPKEGDSENTSNETTEEGYEEGNQGQEGENTSKLDLAMVLTWYKYGNQPKTIVCGPSDKVTKNVNLMQLSDNGFRYDFSLNGSDAYRGKIRSVQLFEGNLPGRQIEKSGELKIELPKGADRREYRFEVHAAVGQSGNGGTSEEQEIVFSYVIRFEESMDLQLEMSWERTDGSTGVLSCDADRMAKRTVTNNELKENVFHFSTKFKGLQAKEAQLVSAEYRTDSGESGSLNPAGGALIFKKAIGSAEETYYLTYTAKINEKTVTFQYVIQYKEVLDVKLSFSWLEKGSVKRGMECQPGEKISVNVKNNQLSGGTLKYECLLTGVNGEHGRILNISYLSESGEGGGLRANGSLPVSLPEGKSSNKYTITVTALVNGQQMIFEVEILYTRDVSLEMSYDVSGTKRMLVCENKKARTAEAVYDDELTEGTLKYQMRLSGADQGDVEITEVKCYQSGSKKTVNLKSQGEIVLLLQEGKTGQNNFMVTAKDNHGAEYVFEINVPYKHRGENAVKIQTNLKNNQVIINETKTNLTVRAWTEDESGKVVDTIPANGTGTKLEVRLDGEVLSYASAGGDFSEYDLYPKNPEKGDSNTHTLYIRAEDAYGNYGELTILLKGKRSMEGQEIGTATIYVDMTVLGLGVVASVPYKVLSNEPVSYVVAKAVFGEDTGSPFGAADVTLGWSGRYRGTLSSGFYLQTLNPEKKAKTLEEEGWKSYGKNEEEIFEAIDAYFGKGTGLATLWRCIYRNGLNKSGGSGKYYGEHDFSQGSGWIYSINGKYFPVQGMDSYFLQDGDVLTLRYTLAYGWDVGSGTAGYGNTNGYCVKALNGSFDIQHKMETVTKEDGSKARICKCCGLEDNCAHENKIWKNLENGFHVEYCEDCKNTLGDSEVHIWDPAGGKEKHICVKCGFEKSHVWDEIANSNTATCTKEGIRKVQCAECHLVAEEKVPAKGHDTSGTWLHDKYQHSKKCKICKVTIEGSVGSHEYVADAYGDYSCKICGAGHDMNYCGNDRLVVIKATCKKIDYQCADCQFVMQKEGHFEEYHSFVDGKCEFCQTEDPNQNPEKPTPEPEKPTPEPEEPTPEPETPTPEPEEPTPEPEAPVSENGEEGV